MIDAAESRSGEDRRDSSVSHLTIMNKLIEHDAEILKQAQIVNNIQQDVKDIKVDLHPISTGIKSMVWLARAIVVIGAIAAALVGIDTFWTVFGSAV